MLDITLLIGFLAEFLMKVNPMTLGCFAVTSSKRWSTIGSHS